MSPAKPLKSNPSKASHESSSAERTRLLAIAAVAIAEQLKTDVSGIRIVSFKKVS